MIVLLHAILNMRPEVITAAEQLDNGGRFLHTLDLYRRHAAFEHHDEARAHAGQLHDLLRSHTANDAMQSEVPRYLDCRTPGETA